MVADRERWVALGGAIAVHLVLFAVLSFGIASHKEPPPGAAVKPVIQARAVSEQQVMEPQRKRLAAEEAEQQRIAEQKRQAREAQRREEAARKEEAQARKRKEAEQRRQAELKKKREAEKARLAELERQRKIEAERKAAEERKKAEAERKRIEEQKRREEQLKAQMAAEAERLAQEEQRVRSAQLSRLQNQYVADIANKVQRNWLRPPESRGSFCRVLINQIPGGDIVGVRVSDCDGDVPFKRSVEAAVRKASPLPRPPEASLFQREIEFIFKPDR